MKKSIRIIKTSNEDSENLQFWSNKSVSDRLSAIQDLREQYILLFNKQEEYNESRKGLRRVCTIIEQTRS
jgi:hypothetical protein